MSFFKSFLGQALSDKGEPSSKRLIGYSLVAFALMMEFITLILSVCIKDFDGGLGYDIFITLIGSGLIALGISGAEKFTKIKP